MRCGADTPTEAASGSVVATRPECRDSADAAVGQRRAAPFNESTNGADDTRMSSRRRDRASERARRRLARSKFEDDVKGHTDAITVTMFFVFKMLARAVAWCKGCKRIASHDIQPIGTQTVRDCGP